MSGQIGKLIRKESVLEALNTIIDPCSVPAGAPAGLAELGIVREVAVGGEPGAAIVRVVLCVTDPGCVMGGPFAQEAFDRISRLPGIAKVVVEFDATAEWTPQDMSPAYADRLRAVREQRLARHRARGREVVMLPVPGPRAAR